MTDVAHPYLPELCQLLRAAGIRIHLGHRDIGRIYPHPPTDLTPTMIAGIKRYKLEILHELRKMRPGAMLECSPCSRCGCEVVQTANTICDWCYPLRNRVVVIDLSAVGENRALIRVEDNPESTPTTAQEGKCA